MDTRSTAYQVLAYSFKRMIPLIFRSWQIFLFYFLYLIPLMIPIFFTFFAPELFGIRLEQNYQIIIILLAYVHSYFLFRHAEPFVLYLFGNYLIKGEQLNLNFLQICKLYIRVIVNPYSYEEYKKFMAKYDTYTSVNFSISKEDKMAISPPMTDNIDKYYPVYLASKVPFIIADNKNPDALFDIVSKLDPNSKSITDKMLKGEQTIKGYLGYSYIIALILYIVLIVALFGPSRILNVFSSFISSRTGFIQYYHYHYYILVYFPIIFIFNVLKYFVDVFIKIFDYYSYKLFWNKYIT